VNGVAAQFLRPAGEAYASFLKAIGAIGDRHGVHEVLLDQDHAGAALLDIGAGAISGNLVAYFINRFTLT